MSLTPAVAPPHAGDVLRDRNQATTRRCAMTFDQCASHVKKLEPIDEASAWVSAGAQAATALPLLTMPFAPRQDGGADLYERIHELAEQFDRVDMRKARQALGQSDGLIVDSSRPRLAEVQGPPDTAHDFYTPQLDAAYFPGLAVGLRAAPVLFGQKGAA